jgi:aspartyl-tRNA(Asn)/glutamyl-tRNA(Gln) amidotransferase subunit C
MCAERGLLYDEACVPHRLTEEGLLPMQQLSHDTVRGIAELAKLDLTDAEVATYAQQLTGILGYFEMLQQLDTSAIGATNSVLPLTNVLRPDVAGAPLPPTDVVANAPAAQDNQFVVSAVLPE